MKISIKVIVSFCFFTIAFPSLSQNLHIKYRFRQELANNVYVLQAQTNSGAGANIEARSVWIDFDDNSTFEDPERLIS